MNIIKLKEIEIENNKIDKDIKKKKNLLNWSEKNKKKKIKYILYN